MTDSDEEIIRQELYRKNDKFVKLSRDNVSSTHKPTRGFQYRREMESIIKNENYGSENYIISEEFT